MKHRQRIAVWGLCAVTLLGIAESASAQLQARNCPQVENQLVFVALSQSTAFRLSVTELGEGEVSIFQFPLNGSLEQAGPSPLDFVFIPEAGFDGSTDFTYRVIPPLGCPRSVQLGRVTLAAGTAPGTPVGFATPADIDVHLCGIGLFAPMAIGCGFLGALILRRKRGVRAGTLP